MKRLVYLIIILITFSVSAQELSSEDYIQKFHKIAIDEMHSYGIPASITLAQGILESGNGNSQLSKKSKNHFGIKCHKGWEGKKVYHDDDEENECFRKYRKVSDSYRDHSEFLKNRARYTFLFDFKMTDYKSWAKGLKKAGYATDPGYADKLISIIERYELWKLDGSKKPLNKSKEKRVSKNKSKNAERQDQNHMVKKGDTLFSISKKYNISVSDLVKINKLNGNTISLGQSLKTKK